MTLMIINLFLLSIAVFVVAQVLPGIHLKNYGTAIVVAVVYSMVNFFMGWFLTFLALPLIFITFGLFKIVINAFLLWITDQMIEDFEIENFTSTLIAAVLIAIADTVLKFLLYR